MWKYLREAEKVWEKIPEQHEDKMLTYFACAFQLELEKDYKNALRYYKKSQAVMEKLTDCRYDPQMNLKKIHELEEILKKEQAPSTE